MKVSICEECQKEVVVNDCWDIQIVTDALVQKNKIIIASNSSGFLPLIKKKDVVLASPFLSSDMSELCETYYIREDCTIQCVS